MDCPELIFTGHAFQRLFDRGISPEEVRAVVESGEHIADYPDDRPHPSCLLLGHVAGRPLHVVVARDATAQKCYVVTAYIPNPALWEPDFRRRKR